MEALAPLFSVSFLRSIWDQDFRAWSASPDAAALRQRLDQWAGKLFQKETAAEGTFVDVFFKQTWGYVASGQVAPGTPFTCWSQFDVANAGAGGGTGAADLALGRFAPGQPHVPQVLCEFKDVRSGLDRKQNRKGSTRSPVEQCFDYLRESRQGRTGRPLPTWAVVTDMNEFRLYTWGRRDACQRFVVRRPAGEDGIALTDQGPDADFQRFLFARMFRPGFLLGDAGPSDLERCLADQGIHERDLEDGFYRDYAAYRETLIEALIQANPGFANRKGRLVRLAQRFLDRCLFVLFCEDMGTRLSFPPNLLRDLLRREAEDPWYDPDSDTVWQRVRSLFAAMRDGRADFNGQRINRFNGGLFAPEPDLDGLHIPARVFCARGQNATPESLLAHPRTLLYFSARYDFGTMGGSGTTVIDLYTLGRVFEQSITDLEYLEARAEGHVSVAELSRRKRDGVYYTPEWVTAAIVQEVIDGRLEELRRAVGLADFGEVTDEDAAAYRSLKTRPKGHRLTRYLTLLDEYSLRLDRLRVLDPACGSGAFLIQAFRFLYAERQRIRAERERVSGQTVLWDSADVMRQVLSLNLCGVDINPESVEITRLALWLHTALPDQPLTSLDDTIRCGNSLVGPEYWIWAGSNPALLPEAEAERVNAFDWAAAFPMARDGFDCIIGNPPYVKLQHFKKVHPDVAEYLGKARRPDGTPLYRSTQTGNFDLYLPFLEKGLDLLAPGGRMGLIAPSLWLVNDYGAELRDLVRETGSLVKWIDFGDFQVFKEATTYTAIQLFSQQRQEVFQMVDASDGDITAIENEEVAFSELPDNGAWHLGPGRTRVLLRKLRQSSPSLGDTALEGSVGFRGIESGADEFYHFRKVGPGKFVGMKCGSYSDSRGISVALEDAAMRPLVSTSDARRYERPSGSGHALFPYVIERGRARLMSEKELRDACPGVWDWFVANETHLRSRDGRSMDKMGAWWGYTRPMNLEKQGEMKLGVPQTVTHLQAFFDLAGEFCFNNVRVGGIAVRSQQEGWFLLGLLNSTILDWCFRQTARKKANGYYEANKQFIAPLPIPDASAEDRAEVARRAKELQELHTRRRDLAVEIDQRVDGDATQADVRPWSFLWADVKDVTAIKGEAPADLKGPALRAWAKAEQERRLEARLGSVQERMRPGAALSVQAGVDDVRFLADGVPIVTAFVSPAESPFIAAQWRRIARDLNVTASTTAKSLVQSLLRLRRTTNPALVEGVLDRDRQIADLDARIAAAEAAMNDLVFRLYGLTPEERAMVEGDR